MQKAISKAWEMLGKELPELRQEAEKAAIQRETGQYAAQITRFRTALAEALSPYANLADRFASIPYHELKDRPDRAEDDVTRRPRRCL